MQHVSRTPLPNCEEAYENTLRDSNNKAPHSANPSPLPLKNKKRDLEEEKLYEKIKFKDG